MENQIQREIEVFITPQHYYNTTHKDHRLCPYCLQTCESRLLGAHASQCLKSDLIQAENEVLFENIQTQQQIFSTFYDRQRKGVLSLEEICEMNLISNIQQNLLSVSDVSKLYITSDIINKSRMKKECVNWLKNHTTELRDSETLNNLPLELREELYITIFETTEYINLMMILEPIDFAIQYKMKKLLKFLLKFLTERNVAVALKLSVATYNLPYTQKLCLKLLAKIKQSKLQSQSQTTTSISTSAAQSSTLQQPQSPAQQPRARRVLHFSNSLSDLYNCPSPICEVRKVESKVRKEQVIREFFTLTSSLVV